MDLSPEEPHIAHVISAVSDLQILRIDADSINLIGNIMDSWAQQLSTPLKPVSAHFIQVSLTGPAAKEHFLFDKLPDNFISSIPTNFSLSDEQVDRLITEGRHLLRLNPGFQELLSDLGNPRSGH
jgi:hypothetical protein